ncbi:MAG: DUF2877 domain-containing protein [Chloroflexota bacterium]
MTLTPHVRRWLQAQKSAVLLHRFDTVINLANDAGEIISVGQRPIQPGPFTLLVDGERPFPHTLSPLTPVTPTATSLIIGPLQIDCRPAELWQPVPNWPRLQDQQTSWQQALPKLQTAVTHHLHRIGSSGPANFWAQFQTAVTDMQAVRLAADRASWQTAVTKLAGFGPGFTPAGDDFLVGFLFGLWATRPEDEVVKLAKIVVETAVPRTTQLSAAWLQAAGRGEAWQPWHELVDSFIAGHDWQPPVNRILNQGATSGVAALLGFIAAAGFL